MTTHDLFSLHFFLQKHTFPNSLYSVTLPVPWAISRVAMRWRHCRQVERFPIASNDLLLIEMLLHTTLSFAFLQFRSLFTSHFEPSTHLVCNISFIWKVLKNSWKGHTPYIRKSHLFLEIFRTSNKLYLEATVQQDMDREYGRTQIWGNTLHQMYNVKEDNAHCVHCSVFPLRVVEAWTYLTKIIKYLFEHFFAPAPTTSRKIKTFKFSKLQTQNVDFCFPKIGMFESNWTMYALIVSVTVSQRGIV